jgi:RNA polymerase sigma-70 factor (ECF subfamily)
MDPERLKEATDSELLHLARQRPSGKQAREAASELLGRYRGHVLRWCQRYFTADEQALDVAQEVLLGAYRNLDRFEERARFPSWLFALTRNRCLDQLRRRSLVVAVEGYEALIDPAPDQAANLEQVDEEEALRRRLSEHLDPREQEAVWLRYVEGMSVEEITRTLRITSASGARGVLQTARRKLRATWPGDEAMEEERDHD